MKTYLCLFLILLGASLSKGQPIKYESTFADAMMRARAEHKLIFVQINTPTLNNRVGKVFQNAELAEAFNRNFVCMNLSSGSKEAQDFLKRYQVKVFPDYLFFTARGCLILRAERYSSNPAYYLNLADAALKQSMAARNHEWYQSQHQQKLLSNAGLREYIIMRQSLGLYDNADLADEYVAGSSVTDLRNYRTALFILGCGPYCYGRTFRLLSADRSILDSIYRTEPLNVRKELNSRMIRNTYAKAVETRSATLAESAARYNSATRRSDKRSSLLAYRATMLGFYKSVRDTSSYLPLALSFYNDYYNMQRDSIRKYDLQARRQTISRLTEANKPDTIPNSNEIINFGASTRANPSVAMILNSGAHNVYLSKTKSPEYLQAAINWSKRSIELGNGKSFAPYDTLAHLLFASGDRAGAESNQRQAIRMATDTKNEALVQRLKAELRKMQSGRL